MLITLVAVRTWQGKRWAAARARAPNHPPPLHPSEAHLGVLLAAARHAVAGALQHDVEVHACTQIRKNGFGLVMTMTRVDQKGEKGMWMATFSPCLQKGIIHSREQTLSGHTRAPTSNLHAAEVWPYGT